MEKETNKQIQAKMSEEERRQWDALYMFVKYEIFGYNEDMNLPSYFVLRLKGMTQGNHIAQTQDQAVQRYGYKVVLKTFEKKQALIKWALSHKQFNDESHKINWVMKLIENSINDVYLSMKDEENRLFIETTDENYQKQMQQGNEERKRNCQSSESQSQDNEVSDPQDIVANFKKAIKKTSTKTWSEDDETLW